MPVLAFDTTDWERLRRSYGSNSVCPLSAADASPSNAKMSGVPLLLPADRQVAVPPAAPTAAEDA